MHLVTYQVNWFVTALAAINLRRKLETMQPIPLSKEESQVVTDIILKAVGKCTIYVFGYREVQFYILVISDVSVTATHLMNEITERTKGTISATVLLHKPRHFKSKLASQQYLFDQVLRNGQRLCLDKANVPYILNHNPQRDLESDAFYWRKCVAVAQFNIQCAKDNPQFGLELCKIALLNQSCVQLALGLIRVFMGYTPNEFGLKFLLQLCGYFTCLPQRLFTTGTENDSRLFKVLCTPAGMLLHWSKLDADEADFEHLLERTQLFLDRAGELATTELNRLTNLNTIP